jgi:hypothetical protein
MNMILKIAIFFLGMGKKTCNTDKRKEEIFQNIGGSLYAEKLQDNEPRLLKKIIDAGFYIFLYSRIAN